MTQRYFAAVALIALFGAAITNGLAQFVPNTQTTTPISSANPIVKSACSMPGQSSAVVEVVATTVPGPTPTPVATGTPTAGPTSTPIAYGTPIVTIYSAVDHAGLPGASSAPYLVETKSGTATPNVTGPGKLYVKLRGDQWVIASLGTSVAGATANVIITCTNATAYVRHGAIGLAKSDR